MNLGEKKTLMYRSVWETISKAPNNELEKRKGWVKLTTPGIPAPHMNGIYLCERDDIHESDLADFVKNEVNYYKERNLNFRWKTNEHTRPRIGKELLKNGMKLEDLLFGFCIMPNEMTISNYGQKNEVHRLSGRKI